MAPRRGGPIDLVDEGVTGHLYEPGNLSEMVGHVQRLVGDAAARTEFSAAARASVEERTWSNVCDALLDFYTEAIAANTARPGSVPTPDKGASS